MKAVRTCARESRLIIRIPDSKVIVELIVEGKVVASEIAEGSDMTSEARSEGV
jgi:hypothetical protein